MDILVLINIVAVLVGGFRTASNLSEMKDRALEIGVSPSRLLLFRFFLLLPAVPIILYAAFRLNALTSVWFPFVVLLCYFPCAYLAGDIGERLDRGYDFERKRALPFKQTEFFVYLTGAGWVLLWIVMFLVMNNK
jgi:hypothetical protein